MDPLALSIGLVVGIVIGLLLAEKLDLYWRALYRWRQLRAWLEFRR